LQKNKRRVILIALLLAIPAVILFPRGGFLSEHLPSASQAIASRYVAENLQVYVATNFPFKSKLQEIGMDLRIAGGKREHNGTFIGEDVLVKNVQAPAPEIEEANTKAVSDFAEYARSIGRQVYFTLIPTASAITNTAVPSFADVFNQRLFIENVYGELAGKLVAIDTYLPLYTNRDQYMFYRTENNVTAYGGYHIYSALSKRMLGVDNPSYNAFDIDYVRDDYYGDLYAGSPDKDIRPDVLILFKYSRNPREYIVTHRDYTGVKTYHTLFPRHMVDIGRDMDVYLGGLSAQTDIISSSPNNRKLRLLLFGDKTALSYLPFLANHYQQITFLDLFHGDMAFENIYLEDYDQILMAYSVESYVAAGSVPSRVSIFNDR
jgi:hypothetical protein